MAQQCYSQVFTREKLNHIFTEDWNRNAYSSFTCGTTDKWINKLWYFHTLEFYSAIKRELSTDMDEYQKTLCLDKETRHKIQHTI